MQFADLIWNNLRQRKLRSGLTIAGIAFAVTAAVSLISVSRGYVRSSEEFYREHGVDVVVVRAGIAERVTSALREQFAERLSQVAGVAEVDGSLSEMVSFGDSDLVGIPLLGFRSGGAAISQFTIVAGRGLERDDRRAVLLGGNLADALKSRPGQTLRIEGNPFTVIGIFQSNNAMEGNMAITSLADVQKLTDRESQVSEFHIRLKPEVSSTQERRSICQAIEALTSADGEPLGLKALPTKEFVSVSSESKLMTAMAYGTSLIAVGLALVGILNTVWMSVLERTRDLGILRALGWSRRRVMKMIFCESLLLAVGGVSLGLVGAEFAVHGLSTVAVARAFVRPELDGLAMLIGSLAGLISGVLGAACPAWRAASISAAEALRYE